MQKILATLFFLSLVLSCINAQKTNIEFEEIKPMETVPFGYKNLEGEYLMLQLVKLMDIKPNEKRPVVVVFHPGGWTSGNPNLIMGLCQNYAQQGMIAIGVQYRLAKPDKSTTVLDCVADAQDAMRYIKQNAKQLHVDLNNLHVVGYSAGGHLAMMTQVVEDKSLPKAKSMILFATPFELNTDDEVAKLVEDPADIASISPINFLRKKLPPITIFHGTEDKLIPYDTVKDFAKKYKKMKNKVDLITLEGYDHFVLGGRKGIKVVADAEAILLENVKK